MKRVKWGNKKLKVCIIAYKLGFNMSSNDNHFSYYEGLVSKLYKIKMNGSFISEELIVNKIKKDLNYSNSRSFNYILSIFTDILNKSILYRLFTLLGITSIIITISAFNCTYTSIVHNIAIVYVSVNYINHIINITKVISRFLDVFKYEFITMELLSIFECFIFFIGWSTQSSMSLLKLILSIILQCYIVDVYTLKIWDKKLFDLDKYILDDSSNNHHSIFTTFIIFIFFYFLI